MLEKKVLRQGLLQKRQALEDTAVKEISAAICHHLQVWISAQGWRTILIFAPMVKEIDLLPLARIQGLKIGLPVISKGSTAMEFYLWDQNQASLQVQSYGIREPEASEDAKIVPDATTVVIAPALAVDRFGQRLGYGGGYYDRYLARYAGVDRLVVISEDFWLKEPIPQGPYDQKFQTVVTENGIFLL